jgi:hypothetical protein
MSRIVNDNPTAGTAVTSADLNQKFSDITTVTSGGVDHENVRAEAIDTTNLDAPTTSGHISGDTIILSTAHSHENGSRPAYGSVPGSGLTSYSATTGPGPSPQYLAHGTGSELNQAFSIDDGEMLRVHWQVWVDHIVRLGGADMGTVHPAGSHTIGYASARHPCWLVWLQWETSPGVWEEVPGQGDFTNSIGGENGDNVSETAATMVIPHGTVMYASRFNIIYTDDAAWVDEKNHMFRRSYNYINNTGSTITILGLRLVVDGLYHLKSLVGSTTNYMVHENIGWETTGGGSADNIIKLGTVHIASMVMRKN